MDLFNSTLRNELGDDLVDLMQIIDDYLQRPRRSDLNMINAARRIYERVEGATANIEAASQFVPEVTSTQAATPSSNPTIQSTKTSEYPQCSQYSNSRDLHSTPTTASTPTTTFKRPEATKPPDDDDVVYISSEPSNALVIDLRTPYISSGRKRTRRRAALDEEVITLDDSWPGPEPPKRTNTLKITCTTVPTRTPGEAQSPPTEREESGLKLSCAVCMEDPFKNEPTATVCGHIFCKKCIYKAIKISKKCPLCNKKINSTTQVHRLYV